MKTFLIVCGVALSAFFAWQIISAQGPVAITAPQPDVRVEPSYGGNWWRITNYDDKPITIQKVVINGRPDCRVEMSPDARKQIQQEMPDNDKQLQDKVVRDWNLMYGNLPAMLETGETVRVESRCNVVAKIEIETDRGKLTWRP